MRAYIWLQSGQLRFVLSSGRDETARSNWPTPAVPSTGAPAPLDERNVVLRANAFASSQRDQIALKADASAYKSLAEVRMTTSVGGLTLGLAPNTGFNQVINMQGVFGARTASSLEASDS